MQRTLSLAIASLIILGTGSQAFAHALGMSSSKWQLVDIEGHQRLRSTFLIDIKDLGQLIELPATLNDMTRQARAQALAGPVFMMLKRQVLVTQAGAPCEARAETLGFKRDMDMVRYKMHWRCPRDASNDSYQLTVNVFDDMDPKHRHLITAPHSGRPRTTVTMSDSRTLSISTSPSENVHAKTDDSATVSDTIATPIESPELARDSLSAPEHTGLGFGAFLKAGAEHILLGWDHVLFLLGILVLGGGIRLLIVVVTSFTIAHAITLALTVLGTIEASASWVEPLIAASIVYVAVENVFWSNAARWRWLVAGVFGLIHGMGLAGWLLSQELPPSETVSSLVAFNLGVELGQLAIVSVVYLLVLRPWSERPWWRQRVIPSVSLATGGLGLYWFIERVI